MNIKINLPLIIMGVAGCGKTTIGKKLAEKINAIFLDADNYHPEQNINKMKQGIPLNDEDRLVWLKNLNELLQAELKKTNKIILACSALKSTYRQILSQNVHPSFVYLKVDRDTVIKRLKERKEHFFNLLLINDQFQILEEPKDALTIDNNNPINQVLEKIYLTYIHNNSINRT